jgi:branched-chain amino acid transport system substrate-binding protein
MLAVLCISVAACGSSKATSSGSSATTTAGTTGGSSAATTGPTTQTAGSPITVGFDAPTSGASPFPTETIAIKGALKYVNTVLGGINGHPLAIDVCQTDETPETNVNCANTFVQDHVVAVLDGYDYGSGAETPILSRAGIPAIGVVAGNETVDTSPNDFFFGPADEEFASGPLQVLAKQGVKSVAFSSPNTPADQDYAKIALIPAAKALGIKLDNSYYNPANTDWAVIADTLVAQHADVVGTVAGSEAQCTSMLEALRAVNVTSKVFLGGCSAFVQSAGIKASVGVLSYTALWQPDFINHAPAVIQAQLEAYKTAMTAVGGASVTDQHGVAAFATVVDVDEVLKMIKGAITPATVKSQFLALKNWQPFLDPPATCDHKEWPGTSTCTASMLVTKIAPDGGTEPDAGTGFTPISPLSS